MTKWLLEEEVRELVLMERDLRDEDEPEMGWVSVGPGAE